MKATIALTWSNLQACWSTPASPASPCKPRSRFWRQAQQAQQTEMKRESWCLTLCALCSRFCPSSFALSWQHSQRVCRQAARSTARHSPAPASCCRCRSPHYHWTRSLALSNSKHVKASICKRKSNVSKRTENRHPDVVILGFHHRIAILISAHRKNTKIQQVRQRGQPGCSLSPIVVCSGVR